MYEIIYIRLYLSYTPINLSWSINLSLKSTIIMSETCKNTFANLIWEENFRGTCKVLIKTVKIAFTYVWRTLEVERFKQE